MCLVYVQFVSLCGSSAHARSSPRCAMASVETSTTVLSGAVPAASGRGRRRTVGLTGQLSIVCIHTMYTGPRVRSPAALRGVGTVSQILIILKMIRSGKGLMWEVLNARHQLYCVVKP